MYLLNLLAYMQSLGLGLVLLFGTAALKGDPSFNAFNW